MHKNSNKRKSSNVFEAKNGKLRPVGNKNLLFQQVVPRFISKCEESEISEFLRFCRKDSLQKLDHKVLKENNDLDKQG